MVVFRQFFCQKQNSLEPSHDNIKMHTCVATQVSSSSLASADRHSSSAWNTGFTSSFSGCSSVILILTNVWHSKPTQLSHLVAGFSVLKMSRSMRNITFTWMLNAHCQEQWNFKLYNKQCHTIKCKNDHSIWSLQKQPFSKHQKSFKYAL